MKNPKNSFVARSAICRHCFASGHCTKELRAEAPILTHINCSISATRLYISEQMQQATEGSEIAAALNISEFITCQKRVLNMLFLTDKVVQEYSDNRALGEQVQGELSELI